MSNTAIVLAAGKATRLLPLTADRPKAMLLVGGKPLLQHAIEAVAAHGVDHAIVVVGPHAERVQAFLKDGKDFGLRVTYVHQAEATGTLEAVRLAFPLVPADSGLVWVVPASLYISKSTLAPLAKAKGDALLADVAQAPHAQGVPEVRGDRLVRMTIEPPVVGSTRIALGVARLGAAFRAAKHQGKTLEQAIGDWAAANELKVVTPGGPWGAVVDPWDLLRINERVLGGLPKGRPPKVAEASGAIQIGRDCTISPTASLIGPLLVGDGCTIGDRSVVGPFVTLRHNTVIGTHCEVRRSILNNNVVLDSRGVVRSSIIDDGAVIGAGFLAVEDETGHGCIVGSDARIGEGSRAVAGAIIPPEAKTSAGTVLQ